MGSQLGRVLALSLLASSVACGLQVEKPTADPAPTAMSEPPRSSTAEKPAFKSSAPEARRLAVRFARAVCEYDARVDEATDFLHQAEALATLRGQLELRASGRARLSWSPLRARSERTTLRVDGVSMDNRTGVVVVRGTLVTRNEFTTVRSFVHLALGIRDGLVDSAEGTCL